MLIINEVGCIESDNKLIEKFIKIKTEKLFKSEKLKITKLFKSRKLKSKKLFKSQNLAKL